MENTRFSKEEKNHTIVVQMAIGDYVVRSWSITSSFFNLSLLKFEFFVDEQIWSLARKFSLSSIQRGLINAFEIHQENFQVVLPKKNL